MDRLSFLAELIAIPGASSDESKVKAFLIDFIQKEMKNWKLRYNEYREQQEHLLDFLAKYFDLKNRGPDMTHINSPRTHERNKV